MKTADNFELIELPDSSVIYLNKHSTVSYAEDFEVRHVELSGEAFFIVAPGTSPFLIKTALGEVEVTGTEFNVIAEKEALEVEVEKGAVVLKTEFAEDKIGRAERAIYQKDSKTIQKGKARLRYKRWMNELEVTFSELGRKIKKKSDKLGEDIKQKGKKLIDKLKNSTR